MTDVGFHGTDEKGPVGLSLPAVDRRHGVDLDRISDGRSGPVCLEVVHLRRRNARVRERCLHHLLERGRIRNGQPHAGSSMVHRRAPDHSPDPVAIGLRLGQALEHHNPASLSAHVPVRRRVERLALAVGREHHRVRAQLEDPAVQDRLHAGRDGQIGLPLLEISHRVVHRHERRRAGGVHGLRRSREAQHEGDPPARTVQVGSAQCVEGAGGLGGADRLKDQHPVLIVADPGVDPGPGSLQPVRIDPRVLERLPARLEHHPLLGIEEAGLDG